MKKKLLLFILIGVLMVGSAATIIACTTSSSFTTSNNKTSEINTNVEDKHVHEYSLQINDVKYLKKEATCLKPAEYYYVCSCGEKGTEYYTYGEKLDHDYISSIEDATCTKDGLITYECSRCHDICTEKIDVLGHDYQETIVNPTCVKEGYTLHTCSRCKDEYKDNLKDPLGHTEESSVEWVTHSDCTHDNSYYNVTKCKVCKVELNRELVHDGVYTHSYVETVIAPTCLEQGYTLHKCSICKDEYKTDYVDAKGHSYENTIIAPKCTEQGYTIHSCKNCTDEYIDTYTDVLGHTEVSSVEWVTHTDCTHDNSYYNVVTCSVCKEELSRELVSDGVYTHSYEETVIAPTCTEQGYTLHKCSICKDEYKSDYVKANGHSCQDTIIAPTCTEKGYTIHSCKNCTYEIIDTYTNIIAHTEVNSVEWVSHSDCTHDNSYYNITTCSVCKQELSRELVHDGVYTHSYVETVIAPTCLEQGYTLHKCSICQDEYKTDYVKANGHSYVETVIAPTCIVDGYTLHKCANCTSEYTDNIVKAKGHSYENTVYNPTCLADGYTLHKCKNCTDEFTDTIVKTTGHIYTETVIAPTCTEQGYTKHNCVNCIDEYIDTYVDALDHDKQTVIEWVTHSDCEHDNSYYEVIVCSRCKVEFSRQLKNDGVYGHVYEDTIIAPTCTEQGYTLHKCSKCKNEYITDYVKANGHSYKETIIPATCTEQGYTLHKCENCTSEYTTDITAKLGHTEVSSVEWITHSDCTHDNKYYNVTTCSVCKQELSRELVSDGVYTHSYEETVIAPTCTEQGYTLHKCSKCTSEYKTDYVDALGHKEEIVVEWVTHSDCTHDNSYYNVTKCKVCKKELSRELVHDGVYTHNYVETVIAPTCTEQGYTLHKCSVCKDEYKTDYVKANGHSCQDTIKAPTCTEQGYTIHSCVNCEYENIDTYTDALGHKEEIVVEWVTHSDCTHDNKYYNVTKCKVCKEELNRELISDGVYTHNYVETIIAPTCTEQGYTLHKCSICKDEYKTDYVDAKGHSCENTVIAPTCTEQGYTIHSCVNCEYENIDTYTDALGHKEEIVVEWVTHSDCTHDNSYYNVTKCKVCKQELSRELIHDGVYTHNYVETIISPTCTAQGYTLHKCSICKDEYKTDYVDAKGHSYQATVIAPTCTTQGYTLHKCKNCNDEYTDTIVKALGHKEEIVVEWVTHSDCTHDNSYYNVTKCTVCKQELSRELIHDGVYTHNYVETIIAPTCVAQGYTLHKCSICNIEYKTDYVDKLGHNYVETITAPTETTDGYSTFTCSRCRDSYTDKVVEKLGYVIKLEKSKKQAVKITGSYNPIIAGCQFGIDIDAEVYPQNGMTMYGNLSLFIVETATRGIIYYEGDDIYMEFGGLKLHCKEGDMNLIKDRIIEAVNNILISAGEEPTAALIDYDFNNLMDTFLPGFTIDDSKKDELSFKFYSWNDKSSYDKSKQKAKLVFDEGYMNLSVITTDYKQYTKLDDYIETSDLYKLCEDAEYLGVVINKDKWEFDIEYQTIDYSGQYADVDNIHSIATGYLRWDLTEENNPSWEINLTYITPARPNENFYVHLYIQDGTAYLTMTSYYNHSNKNYNPLLLKGDADELDALIEIATEVAGLDLTILKNLKDGTNTTPELIGRLPESRYYKLEKIFKTVVMNDSGFNFILDIDQLYKVDRRDLIVTAERDNSGKFKKLTASGISVLDDDKYMDISVELSDRDFTIVVPNENYMDVSKFNTLLVDILNTVFEFDAKEVNLKEHYFLDGTIAVTFGIIDLYSPNIRAVYTPETSKLCIEVSMDKYNMFNPGTYSTKLELNMHDETIAMYRVAKYKEWLKEKTRIDTRVMSLEDFEKTLGTQLGFILYFKDMYCNILTDKLDEDDADTAKISTMSSVSGDTPKLTLLGSSTTYSDPDTTDIGGYLTSYDYSQDSTYKIHHIVFNGAAIDSNLGDIDTYFKVRHSDNQLAKISGQVKYGVKIDLDLVYGYNSNSICFTDLYEYVASL